MTQGSCVLGSRSCPLPNSVAQRADSAALGSTLGAHSDLRVCTTGPPPGAGLNNGLEVSLAVQLFEALLRA